MFQGWARAEVIATAAAAVSVLATVFAGAAARYSAIQAGVARRKERSEYDALKPVVEGYVREERVAGWWDYTLVIMNRLDCSIVCEEVRIISPKGLKLAPASAVLGPPGYITSYTAPDEDKFSDVLAIDVRVGPIRPQAFVGQRTYNEGQGHVPLFVMRSATKSSIVRNTLEVSLKVRRSNERVSYAEIIVVTNMPPVSTRRVT